MNSKFDLECSKLTIFPHRKLHFKKSWTVTKGLWCVKTIFYTMWDQTADKHQRIHFCLKFHCSKDNTCGPDESSKHCDRVEFGRLKPNFSKQRDNPYGCAAHPVIEHTWKINKSHSSSKETLKNENLKRSLKSKCLPSPVSILLTGTKVLPYNTTAAMFAIKP